MLDPDARLMLKLKDGDSLSSEKIIKKYKENVANIIYQFIGDKEEAEDLAIEVFLRVYRARINLKEKLVPYLTS